VAVAVGVGEAVAVDVGLIGMADITQEPLVPLV
jgi:hypothetical protein